MPFHAQFDLQGIVASLKSTTSPKQFGLKIGSWDNFTLETFGNLRIKYFYLLLKALPNEAHRQQLIYLQRAWSNKISPKDAKDLIGAYKKQSGDPTHFKIPKADIISYISSYKDPNYRLTFKFGCDDSVNGLTIFLHVMGVNKKADAKQYIECLANGSTNKVTLQDLGKGNLSDKTNKYFQKRAGSVWYKQGIAHIITSTSSELGVADFLDETKNPNSKDKDTLYIFPAHGEVKRPIKPDELLENQNTLVLSFFDSAAGLTNDTAKSDLLYDLGGACCPPQ